MIVREYKKQPFIKVLDNRAFDKNREKLCNWVGMLQYKMLQYKTIMIQYYLYPLFGIIIPAKNAIIISLIIVVIAFFKNYTVRRVFNYVHLKRR